MKKIAHKEDLPKLFADCSENFASQIEVGQGHERISVSQPLISRSFVQCSALLLVNTGNGAALLKHAGPRSLEVFGGDCGIGEGLQDEYTFFMSNNMGYKVIALPVSGSMSYKRDNLIREVKNGGEKAGVAVEVAEPIKVPSTDWKWQIFYDPAKAQLVTRYFEKEGDGDTAEVCSVHEIPGVVPHNFSDESRAKMIALLAERKNLLEIKYNIMDRAGLSDHEKLESVLKSAQNEIGAESLQNILAERLDDWNRKTAAQICVAEFPRRCRGESRVPPEESLRCVDVLKKFDKQDDKTRDVYLRALFEMAGHAREIPPLYQSIQERSKALVDEFQDTKLARRMRIYMEDVFWEPS